MNILMPQSYPGYVAIPQKPIYQNVSEYYWPSVQSLRQVSSVVSFDSGEYTSPFWKS